MRCSIGDIVFLGDFFCQLSVYILYLSGEKGKNDARLGNQGCISPIGALPPFPTHKMGTIGYFIVIRLMKRVRARGMKKLIFRTP